MQTVSTSTAGLGRCMQMGLKVHDLQSELNVLSALGSVSKASGRVCCFWSGIRVRVNLGCLYVCIQTKRKVPVCRLSFRRPNVSNRSVQLRFDTPWNGSFSGRPYRSALRRYSEAFLAIRYRARLGCQRSCMFPCSQQDYAGENPQTVREHRDHLLQQTTSRPPKTTRTTTTTSTTWRPRESHHKTTRRPPRD